MEDAAKNALLRALPSIDELMHRPSVAALLAPHPKRRGVAALRQAVGEARARMLAGDARGGSDEDIGRALASLSTPGLRPVINATGVVLHTNLGRAPLAERALARLAEVGGDYSNLEYDLDEG